ncbi:MAG TPA: RNA polymerase factor sigma-54 [Bacillales bacterium]|nr:RNA polymerase factor sigma-54 [Bacillales bacterium]
MELGLFQQQTLKPVMTQELRQAISILQYSRQELVQFIREQALENPLIDLQEPSYVEASGSYGSGPRKNSEYNPFDFIEGKPDGLKEDLLQQARCLKLDEPTYKRLAYMIWLIDDDGYLPENVTTETAEELRLPEEETAHLLSLLQKLEPAGVGARNLKECLLLQIDRFDPGNGLAREMVASYLPVVAEKEWQELAANLSASAEEVQEEAAWIQTLSPKPGSVLEYDTEKPGFTEPDVTVKKAQGRYVIMLHDDFMPAIHVNREYDGFLAGKAENEAARYLHNKYKQLRWLVKSIEQRKQTLLKVTETMVYKQQGFLEHGFRGLMPMTLKEVADELGVHESTVSRTVRQKYIQTPHGLYEMRSIFTSKLNTNSGMETSSASVKMLIQDMVKHEDPKRPLSDQKISGALKTANGISVSRRTVAKYREQLHIPASSKRKS